MAMVMVGSLWFEARRRVQARSEGGEADDHDEQGQQQQDQVDRCHLRLAAAEVHHDCEGLDDNQPGGGQWGEDCGDPGQPRQDD